MSPSSATAIATLMTWAGWIFGIRALYLLIVVFFQKERIARERAQSGLLWSALGAAAAFVVASAVPPLHEHSGARLPLVWFVMPFMAWGAVVSFSVAVGRAAQAWFALNKEEMLARLYAAGIWLLAGVGFIWLYRRDPDHKIEIIHGGIPLSFQAIGVIVLLAIAAMTGMVLASRATASRGYAKAIVTHSALIAGSIIFGIPFAFLLITSFKEDRDMSSPNGIVWVPRVQQTVPYFDKEDPIYEGTYEGESVRGVAVERNGNVLTIDIQRPRALRGVIFEARESDLKVVPYEAPLVTGFVDGTAFKGMVIEELEDGRRRVSLVEPANLKGRELDLNPGEIEPIREIGLRVQNYSDALEYLPPETQKGLVYLKNTLILVVLSVVGTLLSSSIVAYAFSRMKFPGRNVLFAILLSTMMLPAAVTLLPQFLIFRSLGWIDTLYPLWVPAFFGSAFNIFLLRQFFMQIPMELEDAAKIDGCSYLRSFWDIMLPQIKPALAVIAIWTFMGAWNNFMGPLIYVNSPENMPLSYALQLFQGERSGEPGLLMAFATLCMLPVLAMFFFFQRYFIEGVTLSGFGGR